MQEFFIDLVLGSVVAGPIYGWVQEHFPVSTHMADQYLRAATECERFATVELKLVLLKYLASEQQLNSDHLNISLRSPYLAPFLHYSTLLRWNGS